MRILRPLARAAVMTACIPHAYSASCSLPLQHVKNVPEATSGFRSPVDFLSNNNGYAFLEKTKEAPWVYHPGWDMNWGSGHDDYGKKIYSIADGVVVWIGNGQLTSMDGKKIRAMSQWGGILIQHNHNGATYVSLYGHAATVDGELTCGSIVRKGAQIGTIGAVGTKYSHLHFEVRQGNHPDPTNGDYYFDKLPWDGSKIALQSLNSAGRPYISEWAIDPNPEKYSAALSPYSSGEYASVPTVRMVYLVPSDRSTSHAYSDALRKAAQNIQIFYKNQLGDGKSFRLNSPIVETYKTPHPQDWYADTPSGSDPSLYFFNNSINDGLKLSGGMWNDSSNKWIFYIDADRKGQVTGANQGVALLHREDLVGLSNALEECRWIGGLGHELGHAFGLPHPASCPGDACPTKALMYTGFAQYPNAELSKSEREALSADRFFSVVDLPAALPACGTASPAPTPGPPPSPPSISSQSVGLDLLRHCQETGYKDVRNRDRSGYGWVCTPGDAGMDLNDACRRQYGSGWRAELAAPYGMYDWRCVR